jgi:hypothetical protein
MAAAYKCDVCGQFFESKDCTHKTSVLGTMPMHGNNHSLHTFFIYAVSHYKTDELLISGSRKADVCVDCVNTLIQREAKRRV